MLRFFTIVSMVLFYLESSRHTRRVPTGPTFGDQVPLGDKNVEKPAISGADAARCTIGEIYANCFNDAAFFQCAPGGPVARPCPAGQYFLCTGEGSGQCDSPRSAKGKGCEMVCSGRHVMGSCHCEYGGRN